MGIVDSPEPGRSRRRTRPAERRGSDDGTRARWRSEGKFYEFTGYTDDGVGHPVTITVLADRVTLTPGHTGTAATASVTRLPVRGNQVEEAPLHAVDRVEVTRETVTQARVTLHAPPSELSLLCLRTDAGKVRHDLEAGIGEAMIAAARQAVPEAPLPSVAALLASDDPAARIEQLAGLRDRGLITEAEFEAKKRQILGL